MVGYAARSIAAIVKSFFFIVDRSQTRRCGVDITEPEQTNRLIAGLSLRNASDCRMDDGSEKFFCFFFFVLFPSLERTDISLDAL